jgi:hypothetical protein
MSVTLVIRDKNAVDAAMRGSGGRVIHRATGEVRP